MNGNSANDGGISIKNSVAEQHGHVDNEQPGNPTHQQSVLARFVQTLNTPKKTSMTPARLEYSWWSEHPIATAVGVSALFLTVVMIAGILIVCLTSPKATIQKCTFNFEKTVKHPIDYDSNPRSVAIGDLNNDTYLDMVVANSAVNKIAVYFGQGDGTFENGTMYPTGPNSRPYIVVVGDLNNDYRLDIAVANYGTNTIGIFVGFDHGSFFTSQTDVSTGASRPISLLLADFNHDTLLDIVTANHGTHSVSLFYGYGDATFSQPVTYSTGYDSHPSSLVSGHFNDDRYLDLAIVNSGTNNFAILLAYGNGSFANEMIVTSSFGSYPSSITAGHFDNDRFLDIAVTNYESSNIGIFLSKGNGTFTHQTTYVLDSASPYTIGVGDVNGDTRVDLVITNVGVSNIGVLLGNGNGSFAKPRMYSTGSPSSISFALGDMNKDNRLDMIVVSTAIDGVEILLGYFEGFLDQKTYSAGRAPRTLATADFNNDTRLDIVVGNWYDDTISILLGYGNGSFANQTTYSTGISPWSVAIGDLNNDACMDIVVTNTWSNDISVLLGYGDGSFARQIKYPTGSFPFSVAIGDLNHDVHLDIVVVNLNDNTLSIFFGYGNGSLANQVIHSTGSGPAFVALGDLNNDARLDIVVTNWNDNNMGIFFGSSNGSFTNQTTYATGTSSYSITIADVNNDTQLDIIITNTNGNNVAVFLGHGNGTFAKKIIFATSHWPRSVGVGDFDNDTRMDLVVAYEGTSLLAVFLGYGNGSFSDPTTYVTYSGSYSVVIGDFNSDSRLDIAVTNYETNTVGILLQYNLGALVVANIYASGIGSRLLCMAVEDINNDQQLDIVVANYGTNNIGLLLGYGNGTFSDQIMLSMGSNSHPWSIAIAYFNDDDQLDVAVANSGTMDIGLLLGNGRGTFTTQQSYDNNFFFQPYLLSAGDFDNDRRSEVAVACGGCSSEVDILVAYKTGSFIRSSMTFSTGSRPRFVAIGDLNKDGRLDFTVANVYGNNVSVFLGYGNGSFTEQMTYLTGIQPSSVAFGDFNNDTHLDMVVTNQISDDVSVFLGYSNGSFANQMRYSTGQYPYFVVVGDFNNDDRLDIVVANLVTNDISILLGYGNGSFRNQTRLPVGSKPTSVAVGDLNNDTRLDIVVVSNGDHNVSVLLGDGNGSFGNRTTYSTGYSTRSIAIADLSNDGRMDIVVAHLGSNTIGVFLGVGDGSFLPQMRYSVGSNPSSLAIADFNSDGHLDIVTANYRSNDVSVLLGYSNGSFRNQIRHSTDCYSFALAVGHLNNDTRLDIIVVDEGTDRAVILFGSDNEAFVLHTSLLAGNGSQPRSFAIGDLNNDTYMDLVIAYSNTDSIGIFLGLGNISFADELTFSTGSHSNPYSIAVGDFNHDSRLDIVVANRGSNSVGIFLGYGDGSFTNQTIYLLHSLSNPSSVAVSDLNNDTILDIVVANHGTNNLGIFLGYGDGTFTNVIRFPTAYGSEPFSVVTGDFNSDRKMDLAVANDGGDSVTILLQTC